MKRVVFRAIQGESEKIKKSDDKKRVATSFRNLNLTTKGLLSLAYNKRTSRMKQDYCR